MDDSKIIGMTVGTLIGQHFPKLGLIAPIIGMKLIGYIEDGVIMDHSYLTVFGIVLGMCVYVYKYHSAIAINWWSLKNSETYTKLNIFHPNAVKSLIIYINNYPEYFDRKPNIDLGDINTVYGDQDVDYSDVKTLSKGQIINITDKNFNVNGFIEIIEIDKTIKEATFKIKYPSIYVHAGCDISAEKYLTKINEKNIDDTTKSDDIQIRYLKYMLNSSRKMCIYGIDIYNGSKTDLLKNRETQYDGFFHPKKDWLLKKIERANQNKEQFSSVFYGPPGTGKSSLVYRMAMSTQRFIVSLDLTSINYKADIYSYFKGVTSNGEFKDHTKTIILLEEFDTVFEFLKKKEKMNMDVKSKWLSKTEDDDNQNVAVLGNPEEFTMRDLLELLQGPVPMLGRMIIATTNKLDEIKASCPALFRSGRLEPIEFGYLEHDEINKLLEYYFPGRSDLHINFNPNIATSKILEFINHANDINSPEYVKTAIKENAA